MIQIQVFGASQGMMTAKFGQFGETNPLFQEVHDASWIARACQWTINDNGGALIEFKLDFEPKDKSIKRIVL